MKLVKEVKVCRDAMVEPWIVVGAVALADGEEGWDRESKSPFAAANCRRPISKQLLAPLSGTRNSGPRPWHGSFRPPQVLSSKLHISPEPSSHHAPKTLGDVSPTFACEKPATKPGAALELPRMDFSNRSAATPLLSPEISVLFPSMLVPCTGNQVSTPRSRPSPAR